MKYANIREEELKNKVAQDYFWIYDCTKIVGNVDFCVAMHHSETELFEQESLLWAEAKKGSADIYTSVVQLILTIGKARSFDKALPPPFLGAFDGEKIAFVPYADIHEVFYQNDFNWNVAPSNHASKEFQSLLTKVTSTIEQKALLYQFDRDDKELERFIKDNFQVGKFGVTKIKIDKNNFMVVYNKWLQSVKPTIAVNWDIAKKSGIIDGDFYLADLLSQDNKSLKDKLFVLLKNDFYELDRQIDAAGFLSSKTIQFTDSQVAHTQFGINTSAHRSENIGTILLSVAIYSCHKMFVSARAVTSRHKSGWSYHKNTFPTCLAKIGRMSITFGTVQLAQVTCYLD